MNEDMKKEMEREICAWGKMMVSKFSWLAVRYEFSERNRTYLINCVHPMEHDADEDYNREIINFYDHVVKKYGDMFYPLITCNSELFGVTDKAETIIGDGYNKG